MFKPTLRLLLVGLLASACGDEGTGPLTRTVTITGGVGNGTVTSAPGGINCTLNGATTSGTCSAAFAAATPVVLTAAPAAGYVFGGWLGPCVGSATDLGCTFATTIDYTVTPSFGVEGTQLFGFAALVNTSQSALIQAIVLGPAVLRKARPPGFSAAAALANGSPLLTVTGSVRVLGTSDVFNLTGTFDSTTGSKSLVLVQTGVDINTDCNTTAEEFWKITGNLSDGVIGGQFCGTNGANGIMQLSQSPSNAAPTPFCGTYQDRDFEESTTSGSWNLVLSDGALEGVANSPADQFIGLAGGVDGTAVTLAATESVDGERFEATGTLSADGSTMSGTWSSTFESDPPEVDSGTWQATTAACGT